MTVVTRFAPSPTGFLHIGGARTALFNYLYAKRMGGKFLLRIEDTDRKRSTQEAVDAILNSMEWLGLEHDDKVIYQHTRQERHKEIAQELLKKGKAYYCYATPEELEAMREEARAKGLPIKYNGLWRNKDPKDAPKDVQPVIRLKAEQTGQTIIKDEVQGEVKVANDTLDDMVLLRGDGTPTYMLAVVVDDYDMGVTHVIRGDDHLTNAFRQLQIYKAMGWDIPTYAHIPLIHGADGAKLSKRHGAVGVETFKDEGYLPEALRNYILRLGWAHGDDEIISDEQAKQWFDLQGINKGAARFDYVKLTNLNAHYIKEAKNSYLFDLIKPLIENNFSGEKLKDWGFKVKAGMNNLKERAKLINDLAVSAEVYIRCRPLEMEEKALNILNNGGKDILKELFSHFEKEENWEVDNLNQLAKDFAKEQEIGMGKVAQPLRAALTGVMTSPPIFEVAVLLGKKECLARIEECINS
ncbi:MAG: glutamate--tRNA ligase [Alphaproteobacteria bacterium]